MHGISPPGRTDSLHARIRADIESRIISGEWPPGYRIPPETALMQTWNCSRMTVNKAVAALAAEGLVERNRRAGTVVARPRMHAAILRIPDIRAELEQRGLRYEYSLLADERRPACCVHLGAEGHHLGPSRFVRCLHLADGRALVLEERHIFLDAVPEIEAADLLSEPPGTWLLGHVPWTEAEHRISAVTAEGLAAKELGLSSGVPCLYLERRTWRGAETVTIVKQTIRGDAFDLVARFDPAGRALVPGAG
jgi:GntR family histidine utilization transcriptional repressor